MAKLDARALLYAAPGDYDPADYVEVTTNGDNCLVVASYTPVGYSRARVVSTQAMDAAARKALPGARFTGRKASSSEGGQWRLGSVARIYQVPS